MVKRRESGDQGEKTKHLPFFKVMEHSTTRRAVTRNKDVEVAHESVLHADECKESKLARRPHWNLILILVAIVRRY